MGAVRQAIRVAPCSGVFVSAGVLNTLLCYHLAPKSRFAPRRLQNAATVNGLASLLLFLSFQSFW